MMEQMEREALDALFAAIDRADLPDDPNKAYPGNPYAYPKAYGTAQYRVADIVECAEKARKLIRREVPA